jgi:hypothetical protein
LPGGLTTLIDASGVENAPHVLDRWWMMVTEGYSTAPQANTSFTYRDGEWNTGTNMIVESTLELERFIGTQWQMLPTVISTGTNNLSTNAQPLVSSIWTAAELASPLPIELISLTGQRLNDQVVILNWLTATERNNAGFEVWRMIEGEAEFSEVGWVSGAGDSQGSIAYEIMDGNVAQVTSYYQLKQIDHDGEYAWTPVVAVAGAEPIGRFFAYPNPASDRVQLAGLPANAIGVTMHDASGRLVRHWGATQNIGGLHELQRGTYMISAMDEDGSVITTRLVLE